MSRIRTVKPEFFSSTTVARVSMPARLLFIGLWTEADDHGRLLGNARRLLGIIFPHDVNITEAHVRGWLDELTFEGLIVRYETRGSELLWIQGFAEHQYIKKSRPSRLPPPPSPSDREIHLLPRQQTLLPAHQMGSHPIAKPARPENVGQISHMGARPRKDVVPDGCDTGPGESGLDQGSGSGIVDQGSGSREEEGPPPPEVLPPLKPNQQPRVDPRVIEKAQETGNVGALLNAVTSAMRPKRSQTIVGLVEAETIPASPDVLCSSSWGREHAARFPALDGNNGRPSLVELVREMWPRFLDRCEHGTPTDALRSLSKWLSEDYATHKNSKAYDDRAAERGGGHKVDTARAATWPEVHAQCVRFAKLRGVDEPPPLEDKERWKEWANANLGVYHEAKRAASKGAA